MLLLYKPKSDTATLSGGGWEVLLPLAHLKDQRLWRTAQSVDTDPANTKFDIALARTERLRALAMGPMNVTAAYGYRIRAWGDAGHTTLVADSGLVEPFGADALPPEELEWEDPWFWLGIEPFDDEERGVWLIHVFAADVVARYWTIELFDEGNADGFVEAGRLFMAETLEPSINYSYDGNSLGFRDNALKAKTLSGGTEVKRRTNPRYFRFSIPILPEDEIYDEVYRYLRTAGFDGEVFVIPDPDAGAREMQRRSFLGRMTAMDALSQTVFQHAGFGAEIEEII